MKYLMNLKLLFIISVLFIWGLQFAQAQVFQNITFSGGLSTNEIIGDNPSGMAIIETDTSSENYETIGGGFIGPNPGINFVASFPLNKKGDFKTYLVADYHWYTSGQRAYSSTGVQYSLEHSANLLGLALGLNYPFAKVSLANAKFYTALEFRSTFIMGDEFVATRVSSEGPPEVTNTQSKPDATRLGAALRLGLEGEIWDRWAVNFNIGAGLVNALMKDPDRGELLTIKVSGFSENTESSLWLLSTQFLIQYKL
jgi:hypothetical protein